jgi:hypothetical protein
MPRVVLSPEQKAINKKLASQKYREANRNVCRKASKKHHEANRDTRLLKRRTLYATRKDALVENE